MLYSVDRLFSFRLCVSDIGALCCWWGEGTGWERVGVCVLRVPFCTVTSAFTLFRIVPSPPPLSVASKFLECSPQVPCTLFVQSFSGADTSLRPPFLGMPLAEVQPGAPSKAAEVPLPTLWGCLSQTPSPLPARKAEAHMVPGSAEPSQASVSTGLTAQWLRLALLPPASEFTP